MRVSRDTAAHVHWLMLVAVTLAGCAGTPHVDQPPSAAASTPPSAPTAAPVSQRAVPDAVNGATDDAVTTAKARPGYRLRNRGGTPVWCHKETPTGSRCTAGVAVGMVLVRKWAAATTVSR